MVDEDCAAVVRSRGVHTAGLETPSRCDVKFDRDVSACYPVVTPKAFGISRLSVSKADDSENQAAIQPDEVAVRYFTADGGTSSTQRGEFSLAVFC